MDYTNTSKALRTIKVKVIARHWLLQMNPEGPDPLMLQTRLRERDGADKESLQDSDSDEDEYSRSESDDNDKNDNDSINSGGEDVILAFIDDEEEVERPATTRSGRSINGRSEIDFLTLKNSEEVPYNGQNLFFELTEVAATSVE